MRRGVARDHKTVCNARQIGRHILGDSVGEILLLRVTAEIGEGQHDDRQARRDEGLCYRSSSCHRGCRCRFCRPKPPPGRCDEKQPGDGGSGCGRGDASATHCNRHTGQRQLRNGFRAQRVDPDRASDVLDILFALILERVGQLVANVVAHRPRNADAAGLGQCFEARGDIDAVAEDVVAVRDDIAEVDADAQPDAPLVGQIGLAVEHASLHLGGTAHRVDDAGELGEQTVSGGLDDAAPVLGDLRIDQLPAMRLEAFERAFLIGPHQARVARHIGGEDRGETAGRGHGCSSPPCFGLLFGKIIHHNSRSTTRARASLTSCRPGYSLARVGFEIVLAPQAIEDLRLLSELKDDLSRFLREAEKHEIVITRHGKPAGVLIGFRSEDDWFDYCLENDPRFLQRIERARQNLRAGRGVKIEDVKETQ
jgi:prevent-host-death family protein